MLDLIGRDGPMSPRDVIATSGIHPATMTGILDRLESGGWITRRPDPDDRRRLIIEADLDRGSEVAGLYGPMSKAINQICSDYSDDDLARVIEFLERVAAAGVEATSAARNTSD